MSRFVAFLRGVSPMNLKMADFKQVLETAGFTQVKTVLSSGNAVFTAHGSTESLERKIEAALKRTTGRHFFTIVRSVDDLDKILQTDPFARFRVPAKARRVVIFGRDLTKPRRRLPVELDGARIVSTNGGEGFCFYVRSPRGPVFMKLIETTFGNEVTTRTWETVGKCVKAGRSVA